ncbi:carbohydrate-binding domain-containing protein [Faecalibacterium prausnitzii]|nr:carbohydrate-binding domain-containing protein [Faecalibacterium prausnitzii]
MGGIDSPRPASQRAAAFILTAAMLTTLAAPAFAKTWYIEDGDITVKASDTGNDVTQKDKTTYGDKDTIITNRKEDASSNTVTIEAEKKDDKVEVTLKDVNIDTSSRNKAAVSVTGEGDTNIKLNGDNALKSDIYRSGIYGSGSGSLTISGGENDSLTAQGGSGANGISSSGSLTISGGSTVTANGGSGTISGGDGICSSGGVTISGGSTVTANGGNGGSLVGGDGIRSGGGLTVSDGTVTAKGGNGDSKDGYGGDGIRSGGVVTISGNTVNAAGGYGGKVGGYGICSFDRVAISGGTVEAAGGNGSTGGGSGIYSSVIDLSGSLELTAKAGSPTGKALLQNGRELDLDTIKDKLDPGAKVTATDANGKTKQVSIPRPVEPEESSSSSDGGSATPSAPAFSLPGLTVTDKDGQRISYTSTQSGNTLTVCVGRLTASFRISLAALRQLRAEGIETITFQTILCSTTLSVDELLAMGGEDAEVVLTHHIRSSTLTVGGKDV